MKLEVGMYVRTINGKIWIIISQKAISGHRKDIIKASHNIMDLIEVGDYVNGLRVEKNKYGELYTSYVYYGGDIGKQCEVYTTWLKELKEDMIYSVVTYEQMKQMAYKVAE